jgi:hypothetical protein
MFLTEKLKAAHHAGSARVEQLKTESALLLILTDSLKETESGRLSLKHKGIPILLSDAFGIPLVYMQGFYQELFHHNYPA